MFSEYLTTREVEIAQEMYNSLRITYSNHQFIKKITPIIDAILQKKVGDSFVREVLARLFELRFFYNLIQSKKIDGEIKYEANCLPDSKSNINFQFTTEPVTWRSELTSIRQSDTLKKEACWQEGDLYRFQGGNKELGAEVKRAQSILINKLYNEKDKVSLAKFPAPEKDHYHVLVIDMRGFNMIGASDIHDYRSIFYGFESGNLNGQLFFDGKLIPGIFSDNHPEPRSKAIRERIHFILFFDEDDKGELRFMRLANPNLFRDNAEMRDVFELFPFK